jgi:hypothetical protein
MSAQSNFSLRSEVFWVVTPCSSDTARRFGGKYCLLSLLLASADFGVNLLSDPEDGGDIFLRIVGLSL